MGQTARPVLWRGLYACREIEAFSLGRVKWGREGVEEKYRC